MTISYPVAIPSVIGFGRVNIRPVSVVGVGASPYTGAQEIYVHDGEWWEAEFALPANMSRANAEEWIGFLLSLNGRQGTFLAGDPLGATARGTWSAGTPLVNGASQTGKTLAIDGVGAGATVKAGDWFSLGSGSSTRLHKVTVGGTANGSGEITLDIWPKLRSSPADNAALTIASAKGLWRLTVPGVPWTLEDIRVGGVVIPCREAL